MSKFGELPSNNLGVFAVKMRIFAAIRPQLDDNLHASRWRFGDELENPILISAE